MDIKKNEKGLNVRMKEGIDSSFFINEDEKERIYLFQGFSKEEEREARVELWDVTEAIKECDKLERKEDIRELMKNKKAIMLKILHSNYLLDYVQLEFASYTGEYSLIEMQYSELKDCWNVRSICSSYDLMILKGILSEDDEDFNQGVLIKGKRGDSIIFDSIYLD